MDTDFPNGINIKIENNNQRVPINSNAYQEITASNGLLDIEGLFLHDRFSGIVWCNNAYYNPNKDEPNFIDIVYNLIDGKGKPFVCRQWKVDNKKSSDLNNLKNTPVNIKGTVIGINDKTFYRLDALEYCVGLEVPKSMFIKEIASIENYRTRINSFIEQYKCDYVKYLLYNLGYLERFKQSTYKESKGKYLGDKLSCLDLAFANIARLFNYNISNQYLLMSMITVYLCALQDKQDFNTVNYYEMFKPVGSDLYNKLIPITSLIESTNTYYYRDNKDLDIILKIIQMFEVVL